MRKKLWYRSPASEWKNGLLIGNGRLAGTIFGNGNGERLGLNHELLFSAKYRNRECNPEAIKYLPQIREHLWSREYYEATLLAIQTQSYSEDGSVQRIDEYKPAGELVIRPNRIENKDYYRYLDMETAVAGVSYDGVTYKYVADSVLDKILIHITGSLDAFVDMEFQPDKDLGVELLRSDKGIRVVGEYAGGYFFETRISVFSDGTFDGKRLTVNKEAFLVIDIETGFDSRDEIAGRLDERAFLPAGKFEDIIEAHVEKYRTVMDRVVLELEQDSDEELPTDERIKNYRKGGNDLTLVKMYFDFGHYLMYSGTVCGKMPMNLQGKWNNLPNPPWQSDYHHDINLEMNYWPAEALGMGDAHLTMLDYIERIVPQARKSAQVQYGCRGIFMGITDDCWARATVEPTCCNAWTGVAAWYGEHFFRHYEYTGDEVFLRERAYPYLKEVCEFYEDFLIPDAEGTLQILPSQSPENHFALTYGKITEGQPSVAISSAVDISLVYEVMSNSVKAAGILGVDADKVEIWNTILQKLQPLRIGSDGRLLEWNEEFEDGKDPGHRHMSHLYGIYPGGFLNEKDTPAYYEAAKKSYDYRMEHGGGHTGWSRSWCANLDARFGRAEDAFAQVKELIREFSSETLLDLLMYDDGHIFQIDGNFGGVTGILEMLVCVYGERIKLLPALPVELGAGSLKGVHLPGGAVCDLAWKDGALASAEITLGVSGSVLLEGVYRVPGAVVEDDGCTRIIGEPGMRVKLV